MRIIHGHAQLHGTTIENYEALHATATRCGRLPAQRPPPRTGSRLISALWSCANCSRRERNVASCSCMACSLSFLTPSPAARYCSCRRVYAHNAACGREAGRRGGVHGGRCRHQPLPASATQCGIALPGIRHQKLLADTRTVLFRHAPWQPHRAAGQQCLGACASPLPPPPRCGWEASARPRRPSRAPSFVLTPRCVDLVCCFAGRCALTAAGW